MSISAMKQALEALDSDDPSIQLRAALALRQAIAEAEKQEPVAVGYEWKPCVKLPIVVHVREQRKGETHVSTREGITPVKEDDLIMRGVAGEEYPIGRELFNRTYTFDTAPVHAIASAENAVAAEREACAKVCETECAMNDGITCAEEIRARGDVHAIDISQERVDETAKCGHEFECPRCGHCCQQREWVGLTDEELKQAYLEVSGNEWCLGGISNAESFYDAIEAKLKEKNT